METYTISNFTGVDFPYLINTFGNISAGGNIKGTVFKEGIIKVGQSVSVELNELPTNQYYQFNLFKFTDDTYCITIYNGGMYPSRLNMAVYRLGDIKPTRATFNPRGQAIPHNDILGAYIEPEGSLDVSNINQKGLIIKDNGECFKDKNPIKEDYDYIVAVKNPEGTFGVSGTPSTDECISSTGSYIIILIIIILIIIGVIGAVIYFIVKFKK